MQDQLSFWLTVLGFFLSVVGAWSTLSKWGASLKNASSGVLKRYLEANQKRIDLAAGDPNYLIAFITKNLLLALFFGIVKFAITPYVASLPIIEFSSRIFPVIVGALIGNVLSTCSIVTSEKRRKHRPQG